MDRMEGLVKSGKEKSKAVSRRRKGPLADTTAAATQLWLVKIPLSLAAAWEHAEGGQKIGEVTYTKPLK
jgi:hypothetical protein